MRWAEFVMAAVMAVFSLYLMWKSAELPVGWISGEGPGGGAFPFWLAAGMLGCSIAVILRWFARKGAFARSTEPYMTNRTFRLFLIGAGSLAVMIGLFHIVGAYVAIPLFLVFYMRFLGNHPWRLTGAVAAAMPVITFFFFEIALHITLPKGVTEPLFYPLYDIFL